MQYLTKSVGVTTIMVAVSAAFAGPLAVDPAAIPAWRGTATFSDGVLNVEVDYAVFAPGAYGANDPSGGTRFVYAYQGFNLSADRPFSNITVGLEDTSVAYDGGFDATRGQPGGVSPFFQDSRAGSGFPANSFRSIFQNIAGFTKVNPGQWSPVLLFTSPAPPQFYSSSVIDEGRQVQRALPSPIPAPASLGILAAAAVVQSRRRRAQA